MNDREEVADGNPVTDIYDHDNDGIEDSIDFDIDNDGIDNWEDKLDCDNDGVEEQLLSLIHI